MTFSEFCDLVGLILLPSVAHVGIDLNFVRGHCFPVCTWDKLITPIVLGGWAYPIRIRG